MIEAFQGIFPKISPTAFIAPSADIVGDVEIGEESSIWYGTVARGDVHHIRIGTRTNIQDLSMLHVTRLTHPLVIGNEITIGHHVTLHGCTIHDRVLIGMSATILDGAVICEGSMIGAGSIVTEGTTIPSGVLAFGAPARVKRPLTKKESAFLAQSAQNYVELSRIYLKK